jgi:benzoyl-CoA 2,3-dioxygenase component B
MFTDRDGKSQLMSLAESSLDPLSRTTRFMLTEEAHHMFVGETGISRILERTCQLMRESGFSEDVRRVGGIDLPTIQRHLNLWFSLSLDLHGSEVSSNAAAYFANGLKGRAHEAAYEEHILSDTVYRLGGVEDGKKVVREVQMRNALNEVLRDWYVADCAQGVSRWNRILEHHGVSTRLYLPERTFNRKIGMYAGLNVDPQGRRCAPDEWVRRQPEWLPTQADREYLLSLMAAPVYERGRFANYIAPPRRGINQKPVDFEYVRTEA